MAPPQQRGTLDKRCGRIEDARSVAVEDVFCALISTVAIYDHSGVASATSLGFNLHDCYAGVYSFSNDARFSSGLVARRSLGTRHFGKIARLDGPSLMSRKRLITVRGAQHVE